MCSLRKKDLRLNCLKESQFGNWMRASCGKVTFERKLGSNLRRDNQDPLVISRSKQNEVPKGDGLQQETNAVNGKECGKSTEGVEGDGIGSEGMVVRQLDRDHN